MKVCTFQDIALSIKLTGKDTTDRWSCRWDCRDFM